MESTKRKHVIFFVDDEPGIGKAVSQTLVGLDCEVICFTHALDCLEAIRENACDLVITDINMPDMDGIELLKAIKQIRPLLPVLIVTGYGDIPIAVKAVKAGAIDFLEKPLDENTFIPVVAAALKQSDRNDNMTGQSLTPTEKKILQLVVDGRGNKEIAYRLQCSIRTVENHRYRLMRKLNVDSTAGLVKVAITMGLASPDPNTPMI